MGPDINMQMSSLREAYQYFMDGFRSLPIATYVAKLEREGSGYVVTFPDIPDCMTRGETLKEARSNARDALTGYLNSRDYYRESLPQPVYRMRKDLKTVRTEKVTVTLDDLAKSLDSPNSK